MQTIRFRLLSIDEPRSSQSDLEVGGIYIGEVNDLRNRVYYTDKAGDEWVFYIGNNCEILEL